MKRAIYIFLVLLIFGITMSACSVGTSDFLPDKNEAALEKRILEKCREYRTISLNELTPFSWDQAYFFKPYASREYIFNTVGFKWQGLQETVSEGMMQIVFVKQGQVVCHIYGYPERFYLGSDREVLDSRTAPKFAVMETSTRNSKSYVRLQWFDEQWIVPTRGSNPGSDKTGRWIFEEEVKQSGEVLQKNGELVVENDGTVLGSFGFTSYAGEAEIENLSGGGVIEFIGQLQGDTAVCRIKNHSPENITVHFDQGKCLVKLMIREELFPLLNEKGISLNDDYQYKRE